MKSIAFLLTVLLVALVSTVAQGANPADYIKPTDLRKACLKKDGGNNVVAAIDKFCKNTNIVVPGPIAGRGASGGPKGQSAYVKIYGKCSPPQWVPQKYCYQQLYYMCWKGNSRGSMEKFYGKKQCQEWVISN